MTKHRLGGSRKHKWQTELFIIRFCQAFMSPIGQQIQMKKTFKVAFYLKRKREWEDSNKLEAHREASDICVQIIMLQLGSL